MLKVNDVCKSHNSVRILNKVSFTLGESETLVITGRNGSGKTTLLNLIARLDKPDSGDITLDGLSIVDSLNWKQLVSYVGHKPAIAEDLTVKNALNFYQKFYCVDENRIEELVECFGIENLKDKKIINLSAGEKKRVTMTASFMKEMKLILLDEPLTNLDSQYKSGLLNYLKVSFADKIKIITTLNLAEFEILEPKIALIKDSYLFEPPTELKQDFIQLRKIVEKEMIN